MADPLLWVGTLACAASAALGLLPLERRLRAGLLCASLLLAPVLVLADNWHSEKLDALAAHPELLVAGALASIVALLAFAALLRDRLFLLPPLLIAALPFRIPVDLGSGSSNLLLPLYAVIAVGILATLLAVLREKPTREPPPPRALRFVGIALAGCLLLYAIQSAYADDPSAAAQNVAFFLAPFAALYFMLAGAEWDRPALRRVVLVLAIEGGVFALVAAGQYLSGELFWNDKVIEGNEAHQYFRVNSLLWDPNILGRYLAVTMVVLAGIVAHSRHALERRLAAALFVVLLLVLVGTFSQSSMIALLAGLLVLLAARCGIAQGIAGGAAVLLALAASIALISSGGLSEDVDSGRSGLIDGGLEIAADHPLAGVGSGGFAAEFGSRFYEGVGFAVESHTEPVTVLAEQGAIGLIAYLALLAVTAGGLILATRPRLTAPAVGPPLAAVLGAAYLTMIVHSMGYAAFLTDPLTWAILAVAVGALGPAAAGSAKAASRGAGQEPAPDAAGSG